MSEWNLIAPGGKGSVTEYRECLPNEAFITQFYAVKGCLCKDGKKLSLKEALAELPEIETAKKKRR